MTRSLTMMGSRGMLDSVLAESSISTLLEVIDPIAMMPDKIALSIPRLSFNLTNESRKFNSERAVSLRVKLEQTALERVAICFVLSTKVSTTYF
mmetsp:Transcript_23379/g.48486  ORF Transcript_23379/g.48486 Transcript_23379/m.48486 type:complete len:94 (-) Transcript_23379:217-498(-)